MARIGAFGFVMLALLLVLGCGGKPASVQETGLDLSFPHCYSFEAWVWIDDNYIGSFTSEQPSRIDLAPGSHTLYAKSNIVVADSFFCWTTSFNITQDEITFVSLDCYGHGCR
jgi:hypothetical protein